MQTFILSFCAFILAIGLLIGIHEYGHFIVARFCKVKVLTFSLGFGPTLLQKHGKKGTLYRLALIPIGGYVKMLDEKEGPVAEKELSQAFNRQPVWKRLAIILAGPIANLVFAFFLYWLIFIVGFEQLTPKIGAVTPGSIAAIAGLPAGSTLVQIGNQTVRSWPEVQTTLLDHMGQDKPLSLRTLDQHIYYLNLKNWQLKSREPEVLGSLGLQPYLPLLPPVIGQVLATSPAAKAGLEPQDKILTINQQPIQDFRELLDYVQAHPDEQITLSILRAGQQQILTFRLGHTQADNKIIGFLGASSAPVNWPADLITKIRYSPWAALVVAGEKTFSMSKTTCVMFVHILSGHLSWRGLSGPVGIAQGAGQAMHLGLLPFFNFLALISISLAILNLLPLPLLDGGQFLINLIESLCGRPIPERIQLIALQLSIFFLFGVMTLALYNDIMRIHH